MSRDEESAEIGEWEKASIKFSACALVDLLGFSSHLETSGYDLRTTIGEQAIRRLECLEEGMALVRDEAGESPEVLPEGLRLRRINDAIICTLDLDDFLVPAIGQTGFTGPAEEHLEEMLDSATTRDPATAHSAYESRLRQAIEPIQKFLGIVARLHLFVRRKEASRLFPGARTVVSTGFRRPFKDFQNEDDALSANFAFANVFEADRSLHGPHLYVENNMIELCCRDPLARNLMRFSCFEWNEPEYDCLKDESPSEGVHWREATEISDPECLVLFRRRYLFRRLNPSPLSYLQHLQILRPCLEGDVKADRSNPYFAHVLDAVKYGVSDERVRASEPPKSFLYGAGNDLDASVQEFKELLLTGESPTRDIRRRKDFLAEQGHPELMDNKEFMAKLDELEKQTVEIPVEPIRPEDMGDAIWNLSEEQLTALLPIMGDDYSYLEFPQA